MAKGKKQTQRKSTGKPKRTTSKDMPGKGLADRAAKAAEKRHKILRGI